MKQQNESVKELEIGKDYINLHDNDFIVIDRTGDIENRCFDDDLYKNYLTCSNPSEWREATESEVIEAFEKHLIHRYGEDWKTMKIKEKHPSLSSAIRINNGLWNVEISKEFDGWNVCNKNGLLYCNGIWVERLEEEPKIHIKEAIKENIAIHCGTEEEANRILGMAHELGYKWWTGKSFTAQNNWGTYEKATCYSIEDGSHSDIKYYKDANYTIINSREITDMKKSTEMKQEFTITPPSGYEIDEENSTFQKIVFRKIKPKFPTKLEEIDRPWYIDPFGYIDESSKQWDQSPNHFTSKESAEQALEFIKLLAFRDAIWEIEGEPENTDIDISFNFKTPEGLARFYKMRREIDLD